MEWKRITRAVGLIEHLCEHGVGHPDEAGVKELAKNGMKGFGIHGCDGCCKRDDFPGRIK